jgi:class 3 adenylate cyclase/tetratricopeptide (TPR) repeat protein
MNADIREWLDAIGLSRYADTFVQADIGLDVVVDLDEADLKELGVSLGDRKRLRKAIDVLGASQGAAPAPAPPPASAARALHGEAERRQLTIMFCDLVGSTRLSVELDPEELREIISRFQQTCAAVAQRFGGNVARFMGDGLLVYFGYPRAGEDDPAQAVRAGLQIVREAGELETDGEVALRTRVGIATGEVVVGDLIGAGSAQEHSVVGETPNLAARLQALAEPDQVVIGEITRRLVQTQFHLADLGQHSLKGFDKPVGAWCVQSENTVASRFEAIQAGDALAELVSRERESDRLLDTWERVASGTGYATVIVGQAGIGKSRLAHSLRGVLESIPHYELRYYSSPNYQHSALYAVVRQLERDAGIEMGDAAAVKLAKLERLIERNGIGTDEAIPFLAPLMSIPAGDYPDHKLSPQRWMERTLALLERYVSTISQRQPVLMLFEDLHWADPTTVEWLRRLISRIETMSVMLVITTRPETDLNLEQAPNVSTMRLDRLDRDDSAGLALQVAGATLPEKVIDLVVSKADGVPLFIEELTRSVIESGELRRVGEHFELVGPLPEHTLPDTLQDLLRARLDRLEDGKEIAQIGAAIGRRFSHRLLQSVCRLDADRLGAAIARLLAADIVSCAGIPPNADYSFKHALIQDSAYASLLRDRRRQLHSDIAAALQREFPETGDVRPETLASHLSNADQPMQALGFWQRAAELATARAAHADAVEYANRALAELERLPEPQREPAIEVALLVMRGRNEEYLFGYASPTVEQTFDRASKLCEAIEDRGVQVPVLLGLCVFNLVAGNHGETPPIARRCVELSEQSGQVDCLIESLAIQCYVMSFTGDLTGAHEVAQRCSALYRQREPGAFVSVTAQNPGIAALINDALVLWQLGEADRSVACMDAALTHADELELPIDFVQAHAHAAELYQLRGEAARAREHALTAYTIAGEHGYDYWQLLSAIHLGIATSALGEPEEGLAMANEALGYVRASGANLNLSYFLQGLAGIHLAAGDAGAALATADSGIDYAARSGEHYFIALLHLRRGEALQAMDPPAFRDAEAAFTEAADIAAGQHAKLVQLRALNRLCALRDRQDRAHDTRRDIGALLEAIVAGDDIVDVAEARHRLTTAPA